MVVSCAKGEERPRPPSDPADAEMRVIRVALSAVADLSTIRVYLPKVCASTFVHFLYLTIHDADWLAGVWFGARLEFRCSRSSST